MFFRKKPVVQPADQAAGVFDPSHEKSLIAEMLVKRSAQLVLGHSELEIIRGVCEAIVQTTPHIRLAWTWFGPSDSTAITPQVCEGPAKAYADGLTIQRNLVTQRGPAFAALAGQSVGPFSISRLSPFGPWRDAARDHDLRHVLALPLTSTFNGYSGIFVVYADLDGYFDAVGHGVFNSLAELFGALMTVAAEREALQRAAYHDALTGLLNRHALDLVDRRVYRQSVHGVASSILLLDLDHFKRINDRLGHLVGDQALQAVASVLRQTLRRGDEAIRWGGEEFLVCLPHTTLADAECVAEKLRAAVEAIRQPELLTVSIGACELLPQQHLTQAVARADEALRNAKATGRNRVCVLN